jgi:2-dehydropantoate 2-reductase
LALTLQNGLGNQEVLAEALGWERVALGVATLGAHLLEPGLLKAAGSGAVSLSANPRLAPLAEVLRSAGLPVETVADPLSLLWGKLVINAAINPLTALLRVPNGALLARPSARSLMADLAREAAEVAAALGIRLPYPDPVEAVAAVARKTADNRSSMLQDVLRGAPTEVDAICGAIARTGDTVGIRTPTNRVLCRLVSALSSSEIAQRDWKETVSESRQV